MSLYKMLEHDSSNKIERNKEYINLLKAKFGNKYNYDNTWLESFNTPITVECKIHGLQKFADARTLYFGLGCKDCSGQYGNKRFTQEQFENRVNENFDNIDISGNLYKGSRDVMEVSCNIHGKFKTDVRYLIDKPVDKDFNPCYKCSNKPTYEYKLSKNNDDRKNEGIFYKVIFTHKKLKFSFLKIGITRYNVELRYKGVQYKDFDFEIISEERSTLEEAQEKEREYKNNNKHNRFHLPSDISFTGRSECYNIDEYAYTTTTNLKIIRDSLLKTQNNICPLCQHEVVNPVCDHHHTGKHKGDGAIRGVICSSCNSLLGTIENAVIRSGVGIDNLLTYAENLYDYLKEDSLYRTKYIYPTEKPKEPKLKKSSYNKLVKIIKLNEPKKKIPPYPLSKKLTKVLREYYIKYNLEPEFYKTQNKNLYKNLYK